jgi:hypothetical protein
MADNQYLSQDDFEQKLKELGYFPTSTPTNEAENTAMQPPVPSPTPDNVGAAEEQVNAQNSSFKPEFPEPTPVAQPDQGAITDQLLTNEENRLAQGKAIIQQPETSKSTLPPVPPVAFSTPQTAPKSTNPLEAPGLNDEALQNAQNQVQNRQLFTGIGNALATAAAAPSGKAPDEAFFKDQMANAQQPVKDIEARRAAFERNTLLAGHLLDNTVKKMSAEEQQGLNTADSPQTNLLKAILESSHLKDSDGNPIDFKKIPGYDKATGNDILMLQKILTSSEHNAALEQRIKLAQENQATKAETHVGDQVVKLQKETADKMNPDAKGFGNEVRLQIHQVQTGNRAEALMDLYRQKDGSYILPPQRQADVNLLITNLLTNGHMSVQALKSITPSNIELTTKDITQWFTSNPQGADQTKWLNDYMRVLKTERNQAQQFVDGYFRSQANDYKQSDLYNKMNDQQKAFADNLAEERIKRFSRGVVPPEEYKDNEIKPTLPYSKHKTGETREIDGKTYVRDANGNWSSNSELSSQ